MAFLGLGADKVSTQTQTTSLDPASQAAVDRQRAAAQRGVGATTGANPFFLGGETRTPGELAEPFFNPFRSQVVDATRAEFDVLRDRAVGGAGGTNQQATLAGGRGGSRQGVAEGVRLGELDRAQTSQIAGLLSSGFERAQDRGISFADRQRRLDEQRNQEGLFRAQAGAGFANQAATNLTGTTTNEQRQKGSVFGDLAGIATVGAGLLSGGTIPAASAALSSFTRQNPGGIQRPPVRPFQFNEQFGQLPGAIR